jgi:hypothetical protein
LLKIPQMSTRLPILTLALAACGGDALTEEAAPLFEARALSAYSAEDRAYVMGHAFGVHLYSRTLPSWIAPSGVRYEPGKSSPNARVGYSYSELTTGSECYFTDLDTYVCPEGETPPPGDPGAPVEMDPPAIDEDDDDRDRDDPSEPPFLDDDCETFLDPAAMQARALRASYDVDALMAEGMRLDEIEEHKGAFDRGFRDALALEDLDENTDFSEAYAMQEHAQEAGMCEHSPLVLDLDGDGILTSAPEDGVSFDLRQSGHPVRTAWPRGGDALLVMDRNGDGEINDGGELFGNAYESEGKRHRNGFRMLSELDKKQNGGNKDKKIDRRDDAFVRLLLWRDANRDGKSTPAELTTLQQAGVVSISLKSKRSSERDLYGNRLALWGTYRYVGDEGKEVDGTMIDVWFRIQSTGTLNDGLASRAE